MTFDSDSDSESKGVVDERLLSLLSTSDAMMETEPSSVGETLRGLRGLGLLNLHQVLP